MVTKRNTRSFVNEELTAEEREVQKQCQPHAQAHHAASHTLLLEPGHGHSNGNACTSSTTSTSTSLSHPPIPTTTTTTTTTATTATTTTTTNPNPVTAHPLSTVTMERSTSFSSSNSSSNASISSSAYSSASSNIGVVDSDLAAEEALAPHQSVNLALGAPVNFGEVVPGMYRSSYPKPENYTFLGKLGLKTIVTLVDKNFTEGYSKFMEANNIQHHVFGMKGTKKEEIPLATMEAILRLVLNRANYPLLIHCNHGKHRTGCVVAVVRKILGWNSARVVQEYKKYAGVKERACDVQYIRAFQLTSLNRLLSDEALHVQDLVDHAGPDNDSGPVVATTFGFRVPHFIRAAFVSMTVLLIWMVSGSKMPQHQRR